MSDTRTSLDKLAKQLRISKEAALRLLARTELRPSPNSKGFVGWTREDVRFLKDNLSPELTAELFEYRKEFEAERDMLRLRNPRDIVSLSDAAGILGLSVTATRRFLSKSNSETFFYGEERAYMKSDVLRLLNSPTPHQALEMKRIKATKRTKRSLTGTQLARMFDVPVPMVSPLKKKLGIKSGDVLTEETVMGLMTNSDFPSKRRQVITGSAKSDSPREPGKFITRHGIAKLLGLSGDDVSTAIRLSLIPKDEKGRFVREDVQSVDVSSVRRALSVLSPVARADSNVLEGNFGSSTSLPKATKLRDVTVTIPMRLRQPESATLYVGPTNSGKTYHALAAMKEAYESNPLGVHVYSAPLRMLAYEVYCKLVEEYGEAEVGFITGEEQINPTASLLTSTVEMTPKSGDTLVLDEAHWMIDQSRGSKWTSLLMAGDYKDFHVLTAGEAKTTIVRLLGKVKKLDVREFTRKTPLDFDGEISLGDIPSKTAVVCFSRKRVYALATALEMEYGRKVGVLYGVLPLAARKDQIQKFVDGDYDIIVTTDVIGHGINLPIDNVVFAETTKYDGVQSRSLHLWEAAQIAGRAGRFGFASKGTIFCLEGANDVDQELVQLASLAAQGKIPTGMQANQAVLSPSLNDLQLGENAEGFRDAMSSWELEAAKAFSGLPLKPSEMKEMKARLAVVETVIEESDAPAERSVATIHSELGSGSPVGVVGVSSAEAWQLVSGPFDARLKTLRVLSEWLHAGGGEGCGLELLYSTEVKGVETLFSSIEELEMAARLISEMKTANIMFGDSRTGVYTEELDFTGDNVGFEIVELLRSGLKALFGGKGLGDTETLLTANF